MHDYGCPEAMADVGDLDAVSLWLERMTNPGHRAAVLAALSQSNERLRQVVREMWHQVDVVLGQ